MNLINKLLGKTYLVNKRSKEIHNFNVKKSSCGRDMIAPQNRLWVTKKKALELIESGKYNGCRWCMPKEDTDKNNW